MTEDDKELLLLAAKAGEIFINVGSPDWEPEYELSYIDKTKSIVGWRLWWGSDGSEGGTEEYKWSPLSSDGDAFRLAVKLKLQITPMACEILASTTVHFGVCTCESNDDPYSATRLAITRAAAEIGRKM